MRKPEDLADEDSQFREACGVTAHYKCYAPATAPSAAGQSAPGCAVACYHGFGANLWSWARVQQQLADAVGGVVCAHDMPGFGLTERSARQEAYRLRTNGDIGRALLAEELKRCSTAGASWARTPLAVPCRASSLNSDSAWRYTAPHRVLYKSLQIRQVHSPHGSSRCCFNTIAPLLLESTPAQKICQ